MSHSVWVLNRREMTVNDAGETGLFITSPTPNPAVTSIVVTSSPVLQPSPTRPPLDVPLTSPRDVVAGIAVVGAESIA